MRATKINICLSVMILLTIIFNGVWAIDLENELRKITSQGRIIAGIFRPTKKLGSGTSGITYRGALVNRSIAMKFYWRQEDGKNEYKMYTYLNAIKNRHIQAYGIPKILYYGTWNNCKILGMSLFNTTFLENIRMNFDIHRAELDFLILFREFVKITKYAHSRGIVHKIRSLEDIAIENNRGCLFDLGFSEDMLQCTWQENIQMAKNDFELFLHMTFSEISKNLPNSTWCWLGLSLNERHLLQPENHHILVKELAEEVVNTNQLTGLRKVFVEFAWHADDKNSTHVEDSNKNMIPFYDHLYRTIIHECDERNFRTTFNINAIRNPFEVLQYDRPPVDEKYFENLYARGFSSTSEHPLLLEGPSAR